MDGYEKRHSEFSWDQARADLDGLDGGRGLNIAHEAVDRHARGGLNRTVAIRWLAKSDDIIDLTYGQLANATSRFANALAGLGHTGGHGVATLMGRTPELYVAALGTLKGGGTYTPLFSAFGPDPVAMRLNLGRIEVLVTTATHYRRKVQPQRDRLPHLRHVLIVGGGAGDLIVDGGADDGVYDFAALVESASESFEIGPTDPDDPALLHFTSGTTGTPKGVVHVHGAVVAHGASGRQVLDLHAGDVFWCTADPGWVTGTSYGIIAPLVNGATAIVDEAEFDAERWYRIIERERVAVFYTAPTALRLLQRVGAELSDGFDLSSLRLVASVGEPLDPEGVVWAQQVFGVPVLDTWWQTETGAIMIANTRTDPVKPGSMGRPLPGVTAAVLRLDEAGEVELDDSGRPVEVDDPDEAGELALHRGWPSMFRAYLDQEDRYRSCFLGDWYRSGDLARRDEDGYFWFVGRNDDLIKSSGHLIGPFEVESALTEHPAVVEAGVIGKPDPMAGSIVKAFVSLVKDREPTDALRRELTGHARKRLGPAVAPREIEFVTTLPHTRSGKIMRRLLRARELGLEEGDTSTLEEGPQGDATSGQPPAELGR